MTVRFQRLARALLAGCFLLAGPIAANAAEKASDSGGELIFISQIVLLLVVGRLLGELMQRINQPAIVGQLLAGIVLGPTVFGTLLPGIHETLFPKAAPQKAMIDAVGQLGVLLILMLTGMETDLGLVKRIGRSAIVVAFAGVALPFGCGFLLGQFIPDSLLPDHANRTIASLFLGTALSISSVKIVALVVRELNFLRRDVGQIIVASAVIEDTIGWVIIAITFGLASQDSFDFVAIAKSVVGTAVFLVVSLTIGRRVMFWLIRWANDVLVSEFAVVTLAIVVMCAMALITHLIGVHTVLGAFVAGILIGESPILVGYIDQQLRGVITALFMPVFFGLAGIGADLSILGDPRLALLTLGLIAIASVGKFSGAFVGGKFGGLSTREALALGCAMNARGSTEVIVATIGLSMGVLSQNLFTMILTMAVVTTTAMPPMLRWALARLPLRDAEKIRLKREEADRKSLIAHVERLLVAVDRSPHGELASLLAGYIAGFRGIPVTVLHRDSDAPEADAGPDNPAKATTQSITDVVKQSADNTRKDEHEAEPKVVDVVLRKGSRSAPEAVATEAENGYGLLFVGLEEPLSHSGEFSGEINGIADEFKDAMALVIARGEHAQAHKTAPRSDARGVDDKKGHERRDADPAQASGQEKPKLRILVPVSGTLNSRFGAELAAVVARSNRGSVTGIYVTTGVKGGRVSRGDIARRRKQEKAVIDDIALLGRRHNVDLHAIVRADAAAGDAILHELNEGHYDIVMMGVDRRQGDSLFFGATAEAVATKAKQSVVLITSPRAENFAETQKERRKTAES